MLTKSQAEQRLAPHCETLKKCIDGGWLAWQEHYTGRHFVLDARARAAIVYCEIIHLAKMLFADASDVKLARRRSTYLLFVGDDIVLRFKKLKNGIPRSVRTERQKLFEMQRPIPGFLPGTYVSAGYELDDLEQAIARTLVVARLGAQEVWSLDLNIGGEQIAFVSSSQTGPSKGRGAHARKEAKKKESQTS